MATLRLRRSWTHWRQSRTARRFRRAQDKLRRLTELQEYQLVECQRLERLLYRPQVMVLPRPRPVEEIPFEELMAVANQQPEPGPMLGPEPPPEPETEPLEPAQLIGLPPLPRRSPSSLS
jgi:hypothetical protein